MPIWLNRKKKKTFYSVCIRTEPMHSDKYCCVRYNQDGQKQPGPCLLFSSAARCAAIRHSLRTATFFPFFMVFGSPLAAANQSRNCKYTHAPVAVWSADFPTSRSVLGCGSTKALVCLIPYRSFVECTERKAAGVTIKFVDSWFERCPLCARRQAHNKPEG